MTVQLQQTEKSFTLQEAGVFVLVVNKTTKLNKIQLTQALQKSGLNPIKINRVNTYSKAKRRGKYWNTKLQKRPNKFLVYLPKNEKIDESNLEGINNNLKIK